MDLDDQELEATRKLNGANNEIKVGDYVRIDKSSRFLGIGKVIKIVGNTVYIKMHITIPISFSEDEINRYKHSSNIKDLIEVGDYVNGEQVDFISKDKDATKRLIIRDNIYFFDKYKSIKSILTKEQFEQNSCKLEEEC